LQEKSEAFNIFKSFKARVENETGRTIKNLQIAEENIALRYLMFSVRLMAFVKSSQEHIHHNKTVWKRERI